MTQVPIGRSDDSKLDVLVVDDDARNLVALEAMLERLDLQVVTVSSGDDALRQLLTRDFAVVLLDVQMPELDGFELAEIIRSRDRCRHLPIIFLTAFSRRDEHIERAYALGAVDFLFKPIVADVLRAKVGVFVDLHRQRRRAEDQASLLREAEHREHERRLSEVQASLEAATLRAQMEAERRANERLQIVADMAIELLASHDTGPVIARMAERLVRDLALDACVVYLGDEGCRHLQRVAAVGASPAESVEVVEVGAMHEVIVNRRRWIGSVADDGDQMPDWLRGLGLASCALFPLPVPDGVLGVLVCGRRTPGRIGTEDISMLQVVCYQIARSLERVRLVEELRRRATELAETDRRKDEFLAMLGHELRNPLAPIAYAAELMKSPAVAGDQFERLRGVIESQVQSMTRLVNDLLDVSRITAGKIELERHACSVNAILERAVQTSAPLLAERRHELRLELLSSDLEIHADATRLVQAIANLVNNAARYTDPGGRVQVAAWRVDEELFVAVRDNGRGIDSAVMPRIFDVFVQSEPARSQGGLGLGLALVQRLVEMHGGTVTAASAGAGCGSEFVVRLPIEEISAEQLRPTRDGRIASTVPLRVLLVEDNRDSREMLQLLLETLGHSVKVAEDGARGLADLLASPPDVAIVDIGLPGLSGYELARRVRAHHNGGSPRLVALTGYGQPEDRARALAAGFDDHLVKPVTPDSLRRLLG